MTTLRAAVRALANTPGFSSVAILTLAVGIASNAALFSVYDRLVLNPVTAPDPSTLVAIWSNNPQSNFNAPALSWPRYVELGRTARSFSSLAISAFDNFTLTGDGEHPAQLNSLRVSSAFFRTLGVLPARGRDFTAADDVPNGPLVCIISHELWTTRFGKRASIVGEVIRLNGQSWQVIGITPPALTQPFQQVQVFAPRVFEVSYLVPTQVDAGAGYAQPIARLAPGVSLAQATAELEALSRSYGKQFPAKLDANNTSYPRDFVDSNVGNLKPTFYTLLGAVGFVLLIACANVASLFVGRLAGRQKEIAVRQSLGATRGAIVRQFLTESAVLSLTAGVIGAALARWGLKGIEVLVAQQLPPDTTLSLNWRALAIVAGGALVSAALVGLIPALHASKTQLVDTLKDAMRGSSGARGGRLRASLIVGEVALSVVLLVGSSLLLVSFISLQRTPPGFDPTGVATAFVGVPTSRYTTPVEQADFFTRVVDQLRMNPRITHAGASISLPINGFGARSPYSVAGRPILPLPERPLAGLNIVSEDYFATLGIPLVAGRGFTAQDRDGAPLVCIVNQSLAAHVFPGESPLGHKLMRGRDAEIVNEIVGVIADVKSNGLNAPAPDEIYYAMRQVGKPSMNVTARTTGDAAALQNLIATAVAQVDSDQPISFFQSLDVLLAQSLGVQKIVAALTAVFAGIALVLAAIGLYSVVSYAAAQRTGEIGIRMALGARPGQVLGLVMSGGLKLVAIGVVLGLAGAAGTARLIQTLLANVRPLDPVVYGSVALFFGLVAAAACFVPSLRASRIDPLAALGDRRVSRRTI
ncbi:MAG TPA: ABC transporter permease [Vicinamibacterales bacterium]|nr:ABC transporter permease [Vicinamibacterales bacterium]